MSSFPANLSAAPHASPAASTEEVSPAATDILSTEPSPPRQTRFDFLDGVRGLAALYVVFHHANLLNLGSGEAPGYSGPVGAFRLLQLLVLGHGHFTVCVFIVLSGFCLMLPIARNRSRTLGRSYRDFMARRARRILPPYYAALALSLLMIGLLPALREPAGGWGGGAGVFTAPNLLTHLFLVHDLTSYSHSINPPLWSIAVEWQIYFLFPPLLLLWARMGSVALLAAAFALGLGLHYAFGMEGASPWFIGLFAMGMIGAIISFGAGARPLRPAERVMYLIGLFLPLFSVGLLFLLQSKRLADAGIVHYLRFETWGTTWPLDVLVGLASAVGLTYLTREALGAGSSSVPRVTRFLESPWIRKLGAFSYSLYLIHMPILVATWHLIKLLPLPTLVSGIVTLVLCPAASIAAASIFHQYFEKPYMQPAKAR